MPIWNTPDLLYSLLFTIIYDDTCQLHDRTIEENDKLKLTSPAIPWQVARPKIKLKEINNSSAQSRRFITRSPVQAAWESVSENRNCNQEDASIRV